MKKIIDALYVVGIPLILLPSIFKVVPGFVAYIGIAMVFIAALITVYTWEKNEKIENWLALIAIIIMVLVAIGFFALSLI